MTRHRRLFVYFCLLVFFAGCRVTGKFSEEDQIHLSETVFSLSSNAQTVEVMSDKSYDIEDLIIDGERIGFWKEHPVMTQEQISFKEEWIEIEYRKDTKKMKITVDENVTDKTREAKILLSMYYGVGASISITQEGYN